MSDKPEEEIPKKDIPESTDIKQTVPENIQNENIPETQVNDQKKEETITQEEKKDETTIPEEKSNNSDEKTSNPSDHNSNKSINEDKKIEKKNETEMKNNNQYNEEEEEEEEEDDDDEEDEDEDDDEDEKEEEESELRDDDSTTPRNTNSPITPGTGKLTSKEKRLKKKKEKMLLREKKKQQDEKKKNKVRYITEEEIELAFKWFTHGKQVISPGDIKESFDQYFTNVSKNDKKYYVIGGIKRDTRHLVNTKEEKIQSEMFNSTQSISSLKKMLLKYPFKIKDYDNAFSILCGSDQTDVLSKEMLNKYIDVFKENEIPVKNDIDKIYKCFDKDKDGELSISDLFKMKRFDLKKISDDFI